LSTTAELTNAGADKALAKPLISLKMFQGPTRALLVGYGEFSRASTAPCHADAPFTTTNGVWCRPCVVKSATFGGAAHTEVARRSR
jgi:hypothetical protein